MIYELKQQPPGQTADRMVKYYGYEPALEFAAQYQEDAVYIFHDPVREAYWAAVHKLILHIGPPK